MKHRFVLHFSAGFPSADLVFDDKTERWDQSIRPADENQEVQVQVVARKAVADTLRHLISLNRTRADQLGYTPVSRWGQLETLPKTTRLFPGIVELVSQTDRTYPKTKPLVDY